MKTLQIKKAIYVVLAAPIFWAPCANQSTAPISEFVIAPKKQQKKRSVQELKEDLGAVTKKNFDATTKLGTKLGSMQCSLSDFLDNHGSKQQQHAALLKMSSSLSRAFGLLHQELAAMQKKYSAIAEKLLENSSPFKKASKDTLEKTLQTLESTLRRLDDVYTQVHHIAVAFTTTEHSIEDAAKKLHKQAAQLQKINACCSRDECLKCV